LYGEEVDYMQDYISREVMSYSCIIYDMMDVYKDVCRGEWVLNEHPTFKNYTTT